MTTPPTLLASAARRERLGLLAGATMAVGAAVSFASARAGLLEGLQVWDLIFARYVVAALLMLPLLLRFGLSDLAGIGWGRGIVLTLLGGAPFALLQTGGYAFAPLAHGAIIAPATVTILSTLGAALFLGERLSRRHLVGGAVVLVGVALVSWDGLVRPATAGAWRGDLLFFLSSVLWAGFTLLIRHWRLSALRATAVVAVLSGLLTAPTYLAFAGVDHLLHLPLAAIALQGLIQGGVQGALTMAAYGQAVLLLGVSRAVLFPATVPALSVLIGIPVVGEMPTGLQVAGLMLATSGLLVAIGVLRRRQRSSQPISSC